MVIESLLTLVLVVLVICAVTYAIYYIVTKFIPAPFGQVGGMLVALFGFVLVVVQIINYLK